MSLTRRRTAALLGATLIVPGTARAADPMPLAIAGLTHGHAHWVFQSARTHGAVRIAGIAEPDRELARRYVEQYGLSMDLVHGDLAAMLDAVKPVAVAGFGDIAAHVDIVRAAAPRGIHVMVEKPLADSLADAREMAQLARRHGIHLFTNYETTWYPTVEKAKALVGGGTIGPLRKAVFHDGHKGPQEIGVGAEFLAWLTDPAKNGGGALTDFGCYGANLMTWLNGGERPVAVTAVTRRFKPDIYPRVDDDATIVVDYASSQAVIQASWNWPVARKDMELYGTQAQIIADDGSRMRVVSETGSEALTLPGRAAPFDDAFTWLRAAIEGRIKPEPFDPSSLENNLIVMEILDAARRSAASGRTVRL